MKHDRRIYMDCIQGLISILLSDAALNWTKKEPFLFREVNFGSAFKWFRFKDTP